MRDRYASLRDGLVGAWIPSVSGSGLLLPDLSGRGNNGTLTNMGPEDWVSGQYGRALDFDGVDDYVQIGGTTPSLGTQYSITAFAKPNSVTGAQVLISYRSTTLTNPIVFQLDRNGSDYRFVIRDDSGTIAVATASGTASIDVWAAIAAVRNGNDFSIYIDGILAGSNTASFGTITTNSINIGATVSGGTTRSAFWNGRIDDCRIFSGVLSSSEIRLLASSPGIGLRPQRRTMYYAPPTGARRRRILTSMP